MAEIILTVLRNEQSLLADILIKKDSTCLLLHGKMSKNDTRTGNFTYMAAAREAYQKIVNEWNLQDTVFCEGPVNNISEKYKHSSIFVLSSRFEGFGLVLAEAMSTGLASVAFACPCGPKDIVKDGSDGLLCENGNVKELSSKICQLIEDEQFRKEMGHKAATNIQRYSLDNIMYQWDLLFKEICKYANKKTLPSE